jgi:DsbC/DsbD-like thiol-disulfide interchange protein
MRTPTWTHIISELLSHCSPPSTALRPNASRPHRLMASLLMATMLMAVHACAVSAHTGENLVAVSLIPEIRDVTEVSQHNGTFWIGVDMDIREGWHVYWRNPGDSGLPTTIRWESHPYLAPGDIHWPRPFRFDEDGITTYGYSDRVTLLVPVALSPDGMAGTPSEHPLKARVNWLVCKEICLPESAELSLGISEGGALGGFTENGAERIAYSRTRIPEVVEDWQGRAALADREFLITLTPVTENARFPEDKGIYFYPDRQGLIEHTAPQTIRRDGDKLTISIPVSRYLRNTPEELRGVLSADGSWVRDHNRPAVEMVLPVTSPSSGQ